MYRVLKEVGLFNDSALRGLQPLWRWAVVLFILLALFAPLSSGGDDGRDESIAPIPDLGRIEEAFERVIERVSESVVGIRVQRRYMATLPGEQSRMASVPGEQLVTVNGSGTIIDREGLIVTNEHVVQSASQIEVTFHDGATLPATLVAADARSDLAVLRVERDDLEPATIADWAGVKQGQWTIVLGNPYGLGNDGSPSVSVGVIANLGRRLPGLGEVDDRFYSDMIQTTAPINPGCSGGPMFSIDGELVGVVTAMHTRAPADEGVGFAIPMTPAKRRLIRTLSEGRQIDYGYFGLTVRTVEPGESQAAGLDPGVGAVVQNIDAGGPADKAGVRRGDLVLRLDDQLIRGPAALAELVGQTRPGKAVTVQLLRGSRYLTTQVTTRRREVARVGWMRGGAVLWRGMRLTDLTPPVRHRMGVDPTAVGVVVIDVMQNSPAERAAVQIGDVIDGIAERTVSDSVSFQEQVRGRQGPVKIRVRTRGELVVRP